MGRKCKGSTGCCFCTDSGPLSAVTFTGDTLKGLGWVPVTSVCINVASISSAMVLNMDGLNALAVGLKMDELGTGGPGLVLEARPACNDPDIVLWLISKNINGWSRTVSLKALVGVFFCT